MTSLSDNSTLTNFLPLKNFKIRFIDFVLYVWGFCLRVYTRTIHMPDIHCGQKTVLYPMELELWMVMTCHAGAENETWVLCKNNQCS